ncbi:hypothetical protein [Pelagicoccus sp. SDUM812005]|uniref:hypothetical protein n=1 Tax=Pelagicoccus sp. SDUM812005 TaxID=3041257 RepID=UPI00280E05DC|nr:hypothetical protein [Pelagicoccus sp. SDUM812005]MDQ8181907.1 hypothetical protein [Pelagicoccus sp. SDUM812005]
MKTHMLAVRSFSALTQILAYGGIGVAVPFLSAVDCAPGTYTLDGINCIEAEPGHYVDTPGATKQTPASPGTYVEVYGASAAQLAPVGTYVATEGASAPTPAPLGSYIPIEGATSAQLASPGYYVDSEGASYQTPAPAGSYIPIEGASSLSAAILAPVGKYIPVEGASAASAALVAPLGSFVATEGASRATLAPPGRYVSETGATAAVSAEPGSFVAVEGATSPTLASPGHYVEAFESTGQTLSPPGRYIPASGASSLSDSVAAEVGTFIAEPGASSASAAILAPAGSYVPTTGASAATIASPGYFVAIAGASAQTISPKGSFVAEAGASAPTLAPAGTYVDREGATEAIEIPEGTWSDEGAVAPRAAAANLLVDGTPIVGPRLQSEWGSRGSNDLGAWVSVVGFGIEIRNTAAFLGGGSSLTQLTLKSIEFGGDAAASVRQVGGLLPLVLDEGAAAELSFEISGVSGAGSVDISLLTDEEAAFGEDGKRFDYRFDFVLNQSPEYDAFRGSHFSESELSDVEATAFLADFDGDGIENGMEFVFGLDPKSPPGPGAFEWLPQQLVLEEAEGRRVALVFSLPVDLFQSLELSVQASSLGEAESWVPIATLDSSAVWQGAAAVETGPVQGGRVSVLVKDVVVLENELQGRRFLRLQAKVLGELQ